ncbi:hypothetical protein HGRIS_004547 [Hohenbuehelia grisea]|uniref:Uncharacterized protein n=1 Tax=Hohenbuehelia grisea TaxID=104357 RepID=A0ABR3JCU7_9AGAR
MPAEYIDQIDDFVTSYYFDSFADDNDKNAMLINSTSCCKASDSEREDIALYALYDRCDYEYEYDSDSTSASSSASSSPGSQFVPLPITSTKLGTGEKTIRWLDQIVEEQEALSNETGTHDGEGEDMEAPKSTNGRRWAVIIPN